MNPKQPESFENSDYDSSLESLTTVAVAQPSSAAVSAARPRIIGFNRKALLVTTGVIGLALFVGIAGLVLSANSARKMLSASDGAAGTNYSVGSLSLGKLSDGQQLELGTADHLAINGQLRVTNTIVIAPTAQPETATAGQIYYDQNTNQPYFYNGTQFVSLLPTAVPVHVTSIGGASGNVGIGNGLQMVDGQLGLSGSAIAAINGSGVTSFQGQKGDVSLNSGNGVSINGTTITNTGVINLTSAASNISISNDGNGGFALNGNVIGGAGASGQIALFTGGSTLSGSILSQSGTTATVGGDLTVTGALNLDGNAITVNGITFTLPTTGPATQTICTTAISCAAGGGTAVTLNPSAPQPDAGTGYSIAVNNTGGGNLLQLQSNGGDAFTVAADGSIVVGGAAAIAGATSVGGNLTVAGTSTFNGNVSITGTSALTVGTGTTTLGGALSVTGAVNLLSDLGVAGNTAISGTLGVTGTTTLSGTLTAQAASSFNALASFSSGLAVTGSNISVTAGAITTDSSSTVTFGNLGAGVVQSDATGLLSSGTLDRNDSTVFSFNLSVANGGTGVSSFTSNGVLYGNGSGDVQATAAGTAGQLLLAGALGVPAFTSLGGDASIDASGALTINKLQGNSLLLSTLATGQVLTYNGTNFVNSLITDANLQPGTFANITGTGDLTTGSISSGFGAISTANAITTSGALQGGTVTATGAINGASVTASGALQGNTLTVNAFTVDNTGAITGVNGITTTGGYTQTGSGANQFSGSTTFTSNVSQTGSGSFSTGTGTVSLNGDTTVASGKTFTTNGTTQFNGSTSVSGSNTFSVGTGATTLGGTLGVTGAATFANNIAVQGGNVTIGATGTNGMITLNSTNAARSTNIVSQLPTSNGIATYQLPSIAGGASDVICTVGLGNCAGSGAGVTHSGSSAGYIPVFNTANDLTNSILFQTGTSIGINTATPGAYVLNVQGGDVNFSGAASIGAGLNVIGASSFEDVSIGGTHTLTVGGNATIGGTLGVTGNTTLGVLSAGATTLTSASVTGTLAVTGNTALSTLSTSGNAAIGGTLGVTGATTLAALSATTAGFTGNVTVGGTLGVTGNTTLNGTTVNGSFSATSGASVSGATSVTGTTDINTTGTATTTIGNASADVVISSNGLKVTAAGAVSGVTTLSVSGAISGATAVNTINGLIINSGALSGITGLTTTGGYTQTGTTANSFTGATTFGASGTALTVNNNATITGTASIGTLSVGAGGITTSGTLSVSSTSASSIAGTLNLTGTGTGLSVTNNATIGGTLAIQGANALTLGTAGSVTGSVALANTTNSYYGILQAAAPDTSGSTGNATYILPIIVAGTTAEVCVKEANNCGASANTVTTTADGTLNTLARFTGAHTIADSSITDDGTTVSVAVALSAASVSTATLQSTGALSITPGGTLTVGASNQISTIQGNASSTIVVSASGFTTTVGFTAPSGSNKTITFPNATGTVCLSSNNCGYAVSGSGVTSLDGRTGALNLSNSSGSGTTITIDNAKADGTTKGIATFNSNDFTDNGSGIISTIQGINTTDSVQFANLTLSGNLTLGNSGVITANTYQGTGSGDITFDALTHTITFTTDNGANSFVFPTYGGQGQVICTSGITCATGGGTAVVLEPSARQDASGNIDALYINKASGTGNLLHLQAGGTDALVIDATGNTTVSNIMTVVDLRTNSITPTAALTIGATTQQFTLQGTGSSVITGTDGTYTTSIGYNFGSGGTAATGNVNYQFQNDSGVAPGTYNVCTTAGNCAGVGGGVTTTGGTSGQIAKFSASGNIADSIIADNGAGLISIGGNLAVGTSGSASLTLGVASAQSGSLVFKNGTNGNTITLVNPSTAVAGNTTIALPNASGTIAVSASGPISLDPLTGQISCASCLTSGGGSGGGVSSVTGTTTGSSAINGALTINNALTSGSAITIDDAKADGSTKGIASFNSGNFTDAAGVINTIQNIDTGASVTFADLKLQGTNGLKLGTNNLVGGNLGQLYFYDGTNDGFGVAFSPVTLTANRTISVPNNSGTIAVAGTGNLSVSAAGVVSIVNNPTFSGTITAPALTSSGTLNITSSGQLNIGGTGQQLSLAGSTSSTLAITGVSGTTTIGFTSPSTNRSITFPDAAGTVCLSTNNCGFAVGGAGVTSLNSLSGALSVANASAAGSTITIDTATTSGTKGIASFNATNFSITTGTVNTIQDIATTAAPSFAGITITGAAQFNNTVTVADGNLTTIGTGGLTVNGATNLHGGSDLTGTTTINTGASSGTTQIGNTSNTIQIDSNHLRVATSGAVSGITTLSVSGAISGATATNTINGLVINSGALSGITGYVQGSGNFDASSSSGSFQTSTGANSLNGATTVTGTNTFSVAGGLASFGAGVSVTSGNLTVGAGAVNAFNNVTATNNTALLGQVGPSNETGIMFSAGSYDTKLYRNAANSLLTPGALNVQGNLSLGVNNSANGTLVFNTATSTKTVSLTAAVPTFAGNVSLSIPAIGAATDTICLQTLGNCAGSGGGVTASGYTQNYITKFSATTNQITVSQLYDDSTFVGINTVTNLGQLSVVASGTQSAFYAQGATTGSSAVAVIKSGGSTGDLLQLQDSSGASMLSVSSTGVYTSNAAVRAASIYLNQPGFPASYSPVLSRDNSNNSILQGGNVVITTGNAILNLTNSTGSQFTTTSTSASTLSVKQVSGQTADILQVQASGSTAGLAGFDKDGNLYVAAGQSVKINGSTSFPSSPTEGQIYFRTDLKQLYVYENGKWTAQGGGSTTLVVAASNSLNKEKADYIGNGTADDVAINAAIAALPATGGQIILLDGTYNITATISINARSNVTIVGQGNSTILKRMFDNGSAGGVITLDPGATSATYNKLTQFAINGNKATYTSSNNNGVYLTSGCNTAGNATISDLYIFNTASNGIDNNGGCNQNSNQTFTRNTITGAGGAGINGTGNNSIVSQNIISGSGASGINVAGYSNVSITNNVLSSNLNGIQFGSGGNSSVSGNTVTNNTATGIKVFFSTKVAVSGNYVAGNATGITTGPSGSLNTVTGNTVVSNTGTGVDATGFATTISGNTISSNGGTGVTVNSSNTIVSGNNLYDNTGAGSSNSIFVSTSNTGNQIVGNLISDTAGTGFAIAMQAGSSNTYLSNNVYSGTGASGIQDNGTNTQFANQQDSNGNLILRGGAGVGINTTSPTASLQNAGGFVNSALSTPGAPTVTNQGTAGSTSYTYAVTAYDGLGETLASTGTTTATGAATLNSTNFNRITPARVSGAVSYKIYRTASSGTPATTGLIGTVAGGAVNFYLDDTGLAGGAAAPASNTTGSATIATFLGINNASPANRLAINSITTSNASTQAAQLLLGTGAISNTGLVIQGVSGQTANLLDVQLFNGTSSFSVNGALTTGMAVYASSELRVGNAAGGCSTLACFQTSSASQINLQLKGNGSQTGDLLQNVSSSGTVYSRFDANGSLVISMPAGNTPSLSTSATGGTLAAGTYYYKIVPLDTAGNESIPGPEASIVTSGSTSTVTVSGLTTPGAPSFHVYRGTTPGGENTYFTSAYNTSVVDTGAAGTAATPPTVNNAKFSNLTSGGSAFNGGLATGGGFAALGTASGGSQAVALGANSVASGNQSAALNGSATNVGSIAVGGIAAGRSSLAAFGTTGVNAQSSVALGGRAVSNAYGSVTVAGLIQGASAQNLTNNTQGSFQVGPGTTTGAVMYSRGGASYTGTGTVSTTSGVATVTGVATTFTNDFIVGDRITVNGETYMVTVITNDTSLTVSSNYTNTNSGIAYIVVPAIFKLQNAGGTPQLFVNDSGDLGLGTTNPGARLQIVTRSASSVGQIIQASASQTADILQLLASNTGVLAAFNANGELRIGTSATSGAVTAVGSSKPAVYAKRGTVGNILTVEGPSAITMQVDDASVNIFTGPAGGRLNVATANAANVGLVVLGSASQSADLAQFTNSSGQPISKFTANGQLVLGGVSAGTQLGQLGFADGTNNGFVATLQLSGALGGNRTISIPVPAGADTVCLQTLANCAGGGVSGGFYINNQTSLQSTANFYIQSAAVGSTTATLKQLGSQTADILQIQASGSATALSGFDANGNIYTAAGQSVKINGSTSFPSSPTEGQLYFRTDNKQLYVYENGKWVAQGGGSTTYTVAASNSVNKEKADFVGDGINDDVAINAAISALPATGGQVILLDGTYNITATIAANKAGLNLVGQGSSTILKRMFNETTSSTTSGVITLNASSVNFSNFAIDGNKATYTNSNNHGVLGGSARVKITFTNVSITNGAGNGVDVEYNIAGLGGAGVATAWQFINSDISSNTGYGVVSNRATFNVVNSTFNSNGNAGMYVTFSSSNQQTTVTNSQFISNGTDGFLTSNSPVSLSSSYFGGNTNYGIEFGGGSGRNSIIGNNVYSNGSDGLHLISPPDLTVIGNNIASNGAAGMYLQGTNQAVISGNVLDSNVSDSIYTNAVNNATINGNQIVNGGSTGNGSGIALRFNSTNIKVTDNSITDTAGTGYAIAVADQGSASNTYLSGNVYSGTGASSIFDSGANTQYANQNDANGNMILRGSAGVGINTTAPTASLQNTGALVQGGLATPAAPTVTNQGTAGSTSYTYAVTATDGLGETIASTGATTATGAATLNGTNFNRIVPARVSGAVSYKIYRTASSGTPSTTGLIGTLAGGAATFQFDDTGIAASSSAPTINTTGGARIQTAGTVSLQTSTGSQLLTVDGSLQRIAVNQLATPGTITPTLLSAPASPSATPAGTTGSTTYTYRVNAQLSSGLVTALSANATTATGNATLTGTNKINLSWTSVAGAVSYSVYRTAAGGTSPTSIGLIGTTTATTFSDTGLTITGTTPAASTLSNGTTYYYKVTALDGSGGESTASAETSQAVSAVNQAIGLNWSTVSGARSYRVYRGTSAGNENVYFATSTNSFTDYGAGAVSGSVPSATSAAFANNLATGNSAQLTIGSIGTATGQLYLGGSLIGLVNVAQQGTPGTAMWQYQVAGVTANGSVMPTAQSLAGSTITGNATLDGTNYNTLSWQAIPGAVSYNIYRIYFGGGTPSTNGLIGTTTTTTFNDTGLAASGSVLGTSAIASKSISISTPNGANSGAQPKFSGNYLYNFPSTDYLQIFDVSNPAVPALANVNTTVQSSNTSFTIAGRYMYTIYGGTPGSSTIFNIYDISNSLNPSLISSTAVVNQNITAGRLSTVTVSGKYAYLVNGATGSLLIYDVSNPAAPVAHGVMTGLNSPSNVNVQGRYLYVPVAGGNTRIYDISNPDSPVLTGNVAGVSGCNALSGRYLYCAQSNALYVIDVSNPAAPVMLNTIALTISPTATSTFTVNGRYLYIPNTGNYAFGTTIAFQVFDVSNPANPVLIGSQVGASGSNTAPVIKGRYAYVGTGGNSAPNSNLLQVYDLGGEYAQNFEAGSAQINSLAVDGAASVNGNLSVNSGLQVSGATQLNGDFGVTGTSYFQGAVQLAGGIQGGASISGISIPSAPTIVTNGTAGSTGYSYTVAAVSASGGSTLASIAGSTASGNATLDGTNFNTVSWNAVSGAISYKVYRTVSGGTPSTTGLIGTTNSTSVNDTGLAASGAVPAADTTARLTIGTLTTSNASTQVAQALISTGGANGTGLIIQGSAAQSADLFQIQRSDGYAFLRVYMGGGVGTVSVDGTVNGNSLIASGAVSNVSLGQLTVYPASAATIGQVTRAFTGQTADLQQNQSSAGTVLSRFDANGNMIINMASPTNSGISTSTSGGTLAANTYYYKITAFDKAGNETTPGAELSQVTTGSTSTITITLINSYGAASYRIYRGTSSGGENVYFTLSGGNQFTDTGTAGTAGTPPTTNNAKHTNLTATNSSFNGANAAGGGAFASGTGSLASGTNAIAFGLNSTASGQGSFAIGGATSSGSGSIALGSSVTVASGSNSVAIGNRAVAAANDSIQLGVSTGPGNNPTNNTKYSLQFGTSQLGFNSLYTRGGGSYTGPGTAATTSGSATLTGTGTTFTNDFIVGDRITVNSVTYQITAIASDTSLTLSSSAGSTASGLAYSVLPAIFKLQDASGAQKMFVDNQGQLGLGGVLPVSVLTIPNNQFVTALDAAGTGSINMFKVNANNEIQLGAALNIDGGIVLPTDAGQVTLVDLPISSSATAGTKNSFSFGVGTSPILTVYGEADGSGNLQNGRVGIGTITPGARLAVNTVTSSSIGAVIQGVTSQSGDYIQFQDNSGAGFFSAKQLSGTDVGLQATNGALRLSGTAGAGNVSIQSATAGSTVLVVKAAASQTGDLLQLQNSGGGSVFRIGAAGYVDIPNVNNVAVANIGAITVDGISAGGTGSRNGPTIRTTSGTDDLAITARRIWLNGAVSNAQGGGVHLTVRSAFVGDGQDLVQLQNGSSANVAKFDANGGLTILGTTNVVASVAGNGTAATAAVVVTGQKGGNTSGTTGQIAGAGASLSLTGGAGGDAASGSTNGVGGAITIQGGAGGSGTGTASTYGNVILQSTGGNVGIGTASPGTALEVSSSATDQLTITGTSTRAEIIINATNTGNQSAVKFRDAGTTKFILGRDTDNTFFMNDAAQGRNFLVETTAGNLQLQPAGGNVGIGVTAPTNKLEVAGSVFFQQTVGTNAVTMTLQANAAQNVGGANLLEVRNSAGSLKSYIDPYGNAFLVEGIFGQFTGADNNSVVSAHTYGDTVKGVVSKGFSATQSANLYEGQDYNGNVLFSVGAAGNTSIKTTGTAAFNIQSAASANTIFNVNTTTPTITIGSATTAILNVTGSENLTGTIAVTGASDTLTASIQGFSGQTADLLNVKTNGATNPQFAVSGTGALTLRSDNSAIFTIMNAANTTTVLTVNTTTTGASLIIGSAANGVSFAANGAANAYELTLAGSAQHSKTVTLTPEFAGAVLDNSSDTGGTINCSTSGTGTMTAGFDSTQKTNYYQWTSAEATEQCYDIIAQVPVPSDWSAWASTTPISVQMNGSSTSNAHYAFQILNTGGTAETSTTYGSQGTFGSTGWGSISPVTLSSTTTGYSADGIMTIKIRVQAKSSATVQVGKIVLNYKSKF